MHGIKLVTPLAQIPGVSLRFLKRLEKLGLKTVRDLVYHFPLRYEDFSQIYSISDLEPGQQATIRGVIEKIRVRQTWRKHMTIVEASVFDETGSIQVLWFNQPYILNVLRAGKTANLAGKVAWGEDGIYLSHPAYEVLRNNYEMRHTGRLVPVYPETRGLTSRGFRFLIQPVLKNLETIKEWIPKETLKNFEIPEVNDALHTIHFPQAITDAQTAKKRFLFENLLLLQLFNLEQKLKLAKEKAPPIKTDIEHLKKIIAELPFELTFSQKKSLYEIIQDLKKEHPMNRLLQGDVGSGKTVIAALAATIVAGQNLQTAFLAPTEVLARQHFDTMKKLFKGIKAQNQPATALLTASSAKILYETDLESTIKKPELIKKIKEGEVKIVIGTHALIQKSVGFKDLGLVIVDEQHRFGVKQRASLTTRNDDTVHLPHFLSMSATPIPRTLMLTVFGDLDLSLITEMPMGRKEIETKIIPPEKRAGTYSFIREEVKKGRQVFVICPRIEKSEEKTAKVINSEGEIVEKTPDKKELKKLELKSVKEEFERLSKTVFPDLRVQMLHGQMKAKEKETTMKEFRDGAYDILVSTSVIEVGVDVPNATIMMIEGADRFGLAQLYQFRGRVGRGEHQSYCFLLTDSTAESTQERMHAILEAKNGFELAEKDLEFRGPGEFLGTTQTGIPDDTMEGLRDVELIKKSRDAATEIVKTDPTLKKFPALKQRLVVFEKEVHLE